MPVGDYCQHDVRWVPPDTPLREAARKMRDAGVGCLVVVDSGRVQGVVTDRDVALAVLGEGRDPEVDRVGALVAEQVPLAVHANMPFGVVTKMLRKRAVRRLPVLDRNERLVGVITADDVLRLVCRELAMLGEAVAAQGVAADPGSPPAGVGAPSGTAEEPTP